MPTTPVTVIPEPGVKPAVPYSRLNDAPVFVDVQFTIAAVSVGDMEIFIGVPHDGQLINRSNCPVSPS